MEKQAQRDVSAANLVEGRLTDGFAGGEGRARALPRRSEHVG